jgi:hypothetical protein
MPGQGHATIYPRVAMEPKKAINRADALQGKQSSLKVAFDIDHAIESHRSPGKRAFMDVARERDARFAPPKP